MFRTALFLMLFLPAILFSQEKNTLPINSGTKNTHEGDSFEGRWNCGVYGYLTLWKLEAGSYYGSYTYKQGTISASGNNFLMNGTWEQFDGGGNVHFRLSEDKMELIGRWNYHGEKYWQKVPWNCKRETEEL
ncbi:MAG: hypothetical protein H7A25_07765 [Leptospiraceae bacterium]|nr:hypothetical protein [Leptospiraceae bacterium]MCP5499781.1 hypothetical protein [Leptospiraceae bacterium]